MAMLMLHVLLWVPLGGHVRSLGLELTLRMECILTTIAQGCWVSVSRIMLTLLLLLLVVLTLHLQVLDGDGMNPLLFLNVPQNFVVTLLDLLELLQGHTVLQLVLRNDLGWVERGVSIGNMLSWVSLLVGVRHILGLVVDMTIVLVGKRHRHRDLHLRSLALVSSLMRGMVDISS